MDTLARDALVGGHSHVELRAHELSGRIMTSTKKVTFVVSRWTPQQPVVSVKSGPIDRQPS